MSLRIFEARKERQDLLAKADSIVNRAELDNKRALTQQEQTEVDSALAKVKVLNPEIAKLESDNSLATQFLRAGKIPMFDGRPGNGSHKPNGQGYLRQALLTATAAEREEVMAFAQYIGRGITASADLTPGGDGGVLIPTFVAATMERNYSQFDSVRSVCRRFPTDHGEDVVFPVLSDSEEAVQIAPAALTGADATVSGDTPPTDLTGPTMHAWKTSSKPVFIPRETSEDTAISIIEEVLGALFARIIRFENKRFTVGTGSGQQEGFLVNATPFEYSGGILDLDAALELAYSVPSIYRPQGAFMCSDATAKYLRKLKTGITGDKTQLWGDGNHTLGTPSTLHGWPVIINNDMLDVQADGSYHGTSSPLAFGDWKKFVVREAEQNTPYVYRYPVPAKDGVGLIAFRRTDSKLLIPEAISHLTVGGS